MQRFIGLALTKKPYSKAPSRDDWPSFQRVSELADVFEEACTLLSHPPAAWPANSSELKLAFFASIKNPLQACRAEHSLHHFPWLLLSRDVSHAALERRHIQTRAQLIYLQFCNCSSYLSSKVGVCAAQCLFRWKTLPISELE